MDENFVEEYTSKLEAIVDIDQRAIRDFRTGKITASDSAEINRKNVGIVKKIIAEVGFPTIRLTSQKAYKAAVLVVLHSDDLEFINKSIMDMQNADPVSIQKRDIAYMIDKVKVIQNLPQLYGTQYKIDKNGTLTYIEIEEPEELENRRAEYGMESFDEYKKSVEKS